MSSLSSLSLLELELDFDLELLFDLEDLADFGEEGSELLFSDSFDLEDLGFLDFELDYILSDNTENFIDDLEENDFNDNNLLSDFFSMTFIFPKIKEDIIKDYVSKNGKENIVNKIISWVEKG